MIAELFAFWVIALWLGATRAAGLAFLVGSTILLLVGEAAFILWNVSTPGKWVFGIRILPAAESVSIWRAFDRGFTAFTIGAGCYLPLVGWYAAIQSYRCLTETGTTVWDRGKFTVLHNPLRWRRFMAAGAAVMTIFVAIVVTLTMFQRF